jgi:hypothetical protein
MTFGMVAQQRGTGGCDPTGSTIPVPAGDQCFYVGAPNELGGNPNTSYVLQVGKEQAGPLYGTAAKTLLRVRGTLAIWQIQWAYKTFKATTVERVQAASEGPDAGTADAAEPSPAASADPAS